MVQNNKITFQVICNEEDYLRKTIEWYNSVYKTDFAIKRHILDEVNFAEIEVSNYKLSDIFSLGYMFGVKEEKLRQNGEIDW